MATRRGEILVSPFFFDLSLRSLPPECLPSEIFVLKNIFNAVWDCSHLSWFFSPSFCLLPCWKHTLQDKKLKEASEAHCIRRYQSALMPPILRKSSWTPEEDAKISELVTKYGAKKWAFIASNLPGRKPKQCKYQTIRGVCFIVYAQATADRSYSCLCLCRFLRSWTLAQPFAAWH